MQVDAHKAADRSVCQQIIRPSRGMQAGLKILFPVSLQGGWLDRVRAGGTESDSHLPGNSEVHSHLR